MSVPSRTVGTIVLALVALSLSALAAWAPAAWAHALLKSSSPAANATLAASPRQIVLTFTESPDPSLSLARVVDSAGRAVAGAGPAQAVTGKPLELAVPLKQALPDGVYTVNWRTVSQTDGHVAGGAYAFGVGAVAGPGSVVTVSLLNSSPWLSAAADAGRWLLYIGLALLVGAASSLTFVFGAKLPPGGLWLLRAAVAAAALGVIVMTEVERSVVGVRSLLPLFVTHEGLLLLALGAAVAFCALAVAAVDLYPGRWSLGVVGATAVVAVFVHMLAGHADAPAALLPLNVLDQWVHMTAIGVWTGGLAWLLLGIRGRGQAETAAAVRAFSRIATVALAVVVVTGVVRALEEVRPLTSLWHTSYGLALLVKVGLVALVVLFAAFNHFRFVPALVGGAAGGGSGADGPAADAGTATARRFGLDARAELAIVLGVFAATAVLSGLAPANGASAGTRQVIVKGSDYATTVRATLSVSPGTVGANDFTVAVDDYNSGKPLAGIVSVSLSFALPARPSMNTSTLSLRQTSVGVWRASGLELSIVGSWNATVLVQEPTGGIDVPLTLRLTK